MLAGRADLFPVECCQSVGKSDTLTDMDCESPLGKSNAGGAAFMKSSAPSTTLTARGQEFILVEEIYIAVALGLLNILTLEVTFVRDIKL